MFDVGFWEMAFIGVIALVVIGPERLPGAARSVGLWVGKGKRMLNEVMSDVKKEMKEYDVEQVKALTDDMKSAGKELKDITQSAHDALAPKATDSELKKPLDPPSDSASAAAFDSLGQPTKTVAKKKSTARKKPTAKKKSATPTSTGWRALRRGYRRKVPE